MFYDGFRKIFWGFIFILLEIHILVIDILPDPVGYFFIYLGIQSLSPYFDAGKKAQNFSIGLILYSIPTLFLENNAIEQSVSGWSIYMESVGILNLVLVFFIFQLMSAVAIIQADSELQKRTSTTAKTYLSLMLIISLLQTFAMNMSRDLLMGYTIFSVLVSLILQITLLVLISRFSKLPESEEAI